MRVLLVGVAPETEGVVTKVLGARGHERMAATDGATGLRRLEEEQPALIILEDTLHDMTAADFCRRARACPQGADAVILVISS